MSDKDEDRVFHSLSKDERRQYFEHHHQSGGDVRGSLDKVVGPVWFGKGDAPKGHRNRAPGDDD